MSGLLICDKREKLKLRKIFLRSERGQFLSYRLDPVTNSHDELSFLPHGVDEFHWDHPCVVSFGELAGSAI
jgi:hypothetical protein